MRLLCCSLGKVSQTLESEKVMLNSACNTLVKVIEPITQPTNPVKDLPLHQGGHAKAHVPSLIDDILMEVFFLLKKSVNSSGFLPFSHVSRVGITVSRPWQGRDWSRFILHAWDTY